MYYPIKLDKMRNFRYGMKALDLIEKKFKKPISKIDMDNLTMEDAATIMWGGLTHEDKELTPEKVMGLVDKHSDLATVLTTMGEAFEAAFNTKENNKVRQAIKYRTEQLLNGEIIGEDEKNK